MNETPPGPSVEGDHDTSESFGFVLRSLVGGAPAPEPRLSDDELIAEIRRTDTSACSATRD